jgi:catechol 2,3-dioxygenase-like lactoylglutathione lyase family enzyme
MTGTPTEGIKIVLHPVSDLAAAKTVYSALLGMEPQADSPYYVGFDAAGQHIGLVPNGGLLGRGGHRRQAGGADGRRRHRHGTGAQCGRHPLGG